MAHLKNSNDFLIGIKDIDEQHERIMKYLEDTVFKIKNGTTKKLNLWRLRKLNVTVDEHFYTEEKLLKKYNHPALEKQMKEHSEIIEKFRKLYNLLDLNIVIALPEHILNDLIDTVKKHIIETDKTTFEDIKRYEQNIKLK
ncbi:MAG: hemerythrin domain-containing protein [Deferribacterota bacterium]|nr:hemerythrin domain-containing protein [Deferribacterota bacterium]